jgi:hypothetical protein
MVVASASFFLDYITSPPSAGLPPLVLRHSGQSRTRRARRAGVRFFARMRRRPIFFGGGIHGCGLGSSTLKPSFCVTVNNR